MDLDAFADLDADDPPRGRGRRRRQVRRAIAGLACCLLLLVSAPVGAFFYFEHRLSSNITRLPGVFDGLADRPARPAGPAGEAVNVLIIGTDRRSEVATTGTGADGEPWVFGAQRSDALMVLHISADRRSAAVVSIPRDTWVTVPGHGMAKVNAAYSYGGAGLAVATVEALTSVRLDHVAVIDWSGFAALIDAVGGIEVTVPETVHDTARGIEWTAGPRHLDGEEALAYVGQRYGLPRGDLDRVARQQVVLRTLMEDSLHQEMRKSPRQLYDFLETVTEHLSVDEEWSTREMLRLALSLREFETARLRYLTMPVAGFGRESGQSVVYADRRAAAGLWGALLTDEVDLWAARHEKWLTPSVVS